MRVGSIALECLVQSLILHSQHRAFSPATAQLLDTAAIQFTSTQSVLCTDSLPLVLELPCGSSYVRQVRVLRIKTNPQQLFYRAKKDMPALLGWKHPWDH